MRRSCCRSRSAGQRWWEPGTDGAAQDAYRDRSAHLSGHEFRDTPRRAKTKGSSRWRFYQSPRGSRADPFANRLDHAHGHSEAASMRFATQPLPIAARLLGVWPPRWRRWPVRGADRDATIGSRSAPTARPSREPAAAGGFARLAAQLRCRFARRSGGRASGARPCALDLRLPQRLLDPRADEPALQPLRRSARGAGDDGPSAFHYCDRGGRCHRDLLPSLVGAARGPADRCRDDARKSAQDRALLSVESAPPDAGLIFLLGERQSWNAPRVRAHRPIWRPRSNLSGGRRVWPSRANHHLELPVGLSMSLAPAARRLLGASKPSAASAQRTDSGCRLPGPVRHQACHVDSQLHFSCRALRGQPRE